MEFNILEILVIVSLIQGLLFCIVLLTQNKFKVRANKYLAYGTFLLVYIGVAELFLAKNLSQEYYVFDVVLDEIPWISIFYIPMLVYFLKSTNHALAESKKLLLLTIPFFIFLFFTTLIHLHHEFRWIEWQFIQDHYFLIYETIFYFSMLFSLTLCTISYFVIKSSNISKNEKKWLKNIWLFNFILLFIWVLDNMFYELDWLYYDNHSNISYPIWLGVAVYVYWLIFKGLIQLKLSQDKSEINALLTSGVEIGKNQTEDAKNHKEAKIK